MKNKKGMLLAEEVLKMVLSVIAIGFLVYLLASLYYSKVEGDNHQKAAEILERLNNLTEYMLAEKNITSINQSDIIISGWKIFPYIDVDKRPNACSGRNCFCFCDDALWGQISDCDDESLCYIRDNLIPFEELDLGSSGKPVSLELYEYEDFIGVRQK